MAVFKCKMCGGTLEVSDRQSVISCAWCGTSQTLPRLDDERRNNLYERANHFRRENNYDRAMSVYETILEEDRTDAEAYWSLVLCTYGVEYVKDPKTGKHVPTCNRTQYTSILTDENYKCACKYADADQRALYESEAQQIDAIQRGILAISQREEPFDIFISYKETDENGARTHDSVLAQELYYQLTNEGYKVFFSRITLEDKLGQEYEPYIFAALNSARVMVVLGTDEKHFNAVWVKNEWSRFLALTKNSGGKKILIPAYRDMDPYDLPREFSHLQAQDMSKLGFMQDLLRGIGKILGRNKKPEATSAQQTVVVSNTNTAPLLRRAHMFLEDGDFHGADECAEKVLDMDPENAHAYVVKLLARFQLRNEEGLASCLSLYDQDPSYVKAIRYADDAYRATLNGYLASARKKIEEKPKVDAYNHALQMKQAGQWDGAINIFASLGSWRDSEAQRADCEGKRREAALFASYQYGQQLLRDKRASEQWYRACIAQFRQTPGYRDSDQLAEALTREWEQLRQEQERQAALVRRARVERRRKLLKITAIMTPILAVCILLAVLTFTVFIPAGRQNKAYEMIADGNFSEAQQYLEKNGTYGDAHLDVKAIACFTYFDEQSKEGDIKRGIRKLLNDEIPVTVIYEAAEGNESTAEAIAYACADDFADFLAITRDGYSFCCWEVDTYEYTPGEEREVYLTLNAVWDEISYSIRYELNGGAVSDNPKSYNPETEDITLVNPTREGYTFLGWTGTDADEPTMQVTIPNGSWGDRTYSANWRANTYTALFNLNGGGMKENALTVTYDRAYTLPIPTRSGYRFLGWFRDGGLVSDGIWTTSADVTLSAEWEIIRYEVVCDLAGGAADNVTSYTVEDQNFTLVNPTRKGYTFIGWSGSGIADRVMTVHVSIDRRNPADLTYEAHWEPNLYTIYFDGAGGVCPTASMQVYYDAALSLPIPTYFGHLFLGWSDGMDELTSKTYPYDHDIRLTAMWDVAVYAIAYELNGGIGATDNPAAYTVYSEYTLVSPTRTGYDFTGWTWNSYMDPVVAPTIKAGGIGDLVYTAHWTPKEYSVTLDPSDGVSETEQVTLTYDMPYTLPTPTREGYTFLGWYTEATEGTRYDGQKWTIDSAVTMYAQWQAKEYGITYENTKKNMITVTYCEYYEDGSDYVLTLAAGESFRHSYPPMRDGYAFGGWYTDQACTTAYGFTGEQAEDLTLYPKWYSHTASHVYGLSNSSGYYEFSTTTQTHAFVPLADSKIMIYTYSSGYRITKYVSVVDAQTGAVVAEDEDSYGIYLTCNVTGGRLYYIHFRATGTEEVRLDFMGYAYPNETVTTPGTPYEWREGTQAEETITYGDAFTLPELTRDGYIFLGWFNGDEKVEDGIWHYTEDIILTPHWELENNTDA